MDNKIVVTESELKELIGRSIRDRLNTVKQNDQQDDNVVSLDDDINLGITNLE